MAGVRVEIDDKAVVDALNQLLDKSSDLKPFFYEAGNFIDSELQEQFQNSTDAYGFPWIPSQRALGEDDSKSRAELLSNSGKTLVDHGHLRDSFHTLISFDGNSVIFGSDMAYAAIHQFGGDTGKNLATHLPARPMLPDDGWPTNWEEEILTLITDHLDS